MTRGELDSVHAIGVFHCQFAAFVFFGRVEEKRCGKVSANSMRRAGHLADRVINMCAEGLTALVSIEQRGENL